MIAQLRVLWAEGHTTAVIGRKLGVSKNSVVGKKRRLRLPDRPDPIIRDGRPRRPAMPRVVRIRPVQRKLPECLLMAATMPPKPLKPQPVSIIIPHYDPKRTCQWVTNDRRPWTFCGDRALFGKSWCPHHYSIVYRPRLMAEAA